MAVAGSALVAAVAAVGESVDAAIEVVTQALIAGKVRPHAVAVVYWDRLSVAGSQDRT